MNAAANDVVRIFLHMIMARRVYMFVCMYACVYVCMCLCVSEVRIAMSTGDKGIVKWEWRWQMCVLSNRACHEHLLV